MNAVDEFLKYGSTRRQALKTLGVAATAGLAGCSSQESSGSGGQPESEPDSEPESQPDPETETTEEPENQYQDFQPEPMSLREFAEKASYETHPLILSAYDPQKLAEEYNHDVFSQGATFPYELGFDQTDSPVALFQYIREGVDVEGGIKLRAGQLPAKHPRERVVQNFLDGNFESLSTNDNWDILGDGQTAQVVNDEMIATTWNPGAQPQEYVRDLQKYAESYGQNHFSQEVSEQAKSLDGEDLLTVHMSDSLEYLPLARESVQPEGAVMRGNMGEGVETAWIFEHKNVAEGAAEMVREREESQQRSYNPPVETDSTYVIIDGNENSITNSIDDSSYVLTIGDPTM